MPPRENSLGVPGQAASDAQHLQNVRQQGANYRGQQIYNDPTTHAGREAQAAWLKNNPIPQQSTDTVYGGVNYGNKLQKDTEVAVDQNTLRQGGGVGTASAMMRAGLIDANGYKPNTPGVNSRDTRSEADQHAHHDRVMADIKREGAEARARGEQFQPKGVNVINPSKRGDISGDRRRLELANGEPKFSRDEGGVNYVGPKKLPAPLAAPTPAPVAQATPVPTGQPWKSKEAEKMYNDAVNKPGSGYNGNVNMGGGSLGGAAAQRPQISSLPGGQQTTAQLQQSGQMAPRPAGRYGMTDEQWFNTPEGQKQAQALKDTHAGLLKDGKIGPSSGTAEMGEFPGYGNVGEGDAGLEKNGFDSPELPKPDPRIQAGIAPPMGSTQSGGFSAPLKSKEQLATEERAKQEQIKQKTHEMLYGDLENQVQKHQNDLKNAPGIQRPTPPPSSGIKGSTTPRAPAPKPKEPFTIGNFTQAVDENSPPVGPKPSRVPQTPAFKEGMQFKSPVMQQFNTPKPVEGVDKMPSIKKSSPITDTIKAANNPVPVAQPNPKQKIQPVRNVIKRIRGR